jgi:Uma2 family endonuclease
VKLSDIRLIYKEISSPVLEGKEASMGQLAHHSHYTSQQYLDIKRKSDYKNEDIDGHIYAMAVVSWQHNQITFNIAGQLQIYLSSQPSFTYVSDMHINVPHINFYNYPRIATDFHKPQLKILIWIYY